MARDDDWDLINVSMFKSLYRHRRANGSVSYRFRLPSGKKVSLLGKPNGKVFWEHYNALSSGKGSLDEIRESVYRNVVLEDFPTRKISYMLRKARERAAKKQISYDLSAEWVVDSFIAQEGRCALSGIEMEFTRSEGKAAFAPSIDRIDNKKGYTPENCRLLCSITNLARLDWPDPEFIKMCKAVTEMNR